MREAVQEHPETIMGLPGQAISPMAQAAHLDQPLAAADMVAAEPVPAPMRLQAPAAKVLR